MNMTVSMLTMYSEQVPAERARKIMMMAEASVYPHATQVGRQRIWSSWTGQLYRALSKAADAVGQQFTVNGIPVKARGLKHFVRKRIENAVVESNA